MKILDILSNETINDADALQQVTEIVAKAREDYGNTEIEIPVPILSCACGTRPLTALDNKERRDFAIHVVKELKEALRDELDEVVGLVPERKALELIATEATLVNLTTKDTIENSLL